MAPTPLPVSAPKRAVPLRSSGQNQSLHADAWATLVDVLREKLRLTTTRQAGDPDPSGTCTVLLDGRRADDASLTLTVVHPNAQVVTQEGLALVDASQHQPNNGYRVPGQLSAAMGLMLDGRLHSLEDVCEATRRLGQWVVPPNQMPLFPDADMRVAR